MTHITMRDTVYNTGFVSEVLANADNEDLLKNAEELLEYYDDLKSNPLNLNSAGEHELKSLMLLTDFQIVSLLKYISEHGPVYSFAELSALHGFDEKTAYSLSPYVYFGDVKSKGFLSDFKSESYTRYVLRKTSDHKGFSDHFLTKYKGDFSGRASAFLITEKDPGEKFGDYTSASMSFYDVKLSDSPEGGLKADVIVAGDISAKFGQGLTLWNSVSFAGGEEAGGYSRRGAAISGYTSSDECRALRGLGTTLSYKSLSVTTLYSYRGIDAVLNNDGSYKTIKYDGLHNSKSSLASHNSMKESVIGLRGEALFKKIKIGFSYAGYTFDRHNGTILNYYNKRQYYDGYNYNAAIDIYGVKGNLIMFAEGAYSPALNGGIACLAGASFSYGGWDFHFLSRYYSDNYIAPHAGAYSTLQTVANQRGVSFVAAGKLYKNWVMALGGEYTFYPHYRYGIRASSSTSKYYVKIGRSSFYDENTVSLKIQYKRNVAFLTSPKIENLVGLKFNVKWKLYDFLILGGRVQSNFYFAGSGKSIQNKSMQGKSESSYAGQATASFILWDARIKLHFGLTSYCVKDWATRIYFYEYDLPQTFSSSLLYGSATDYFGVLQLKIARKLSLYFKAGRRKESVSYKSAVKLSF